MTAWGGDSLSNLLIHNSIRSTQRAIRVLRFLYSAATYNNQINNME